MGSDVKKYFVTFYEKIPGPYLGENTFSTEWRNRILIVMLRMEIIIGFFAYLPSVLHGYANGLYSIIILDTIIYITVLYLYFSKRLSAHFKALGSIVAIFVLSIALLFILGKDGPGLMWLLLTAFLASFLYGRKGATISNLFALLTFILFSFVVASSHQSIANYQNYEMDTWILSAINYMVISLIISFVIAETIRGIEQSLESEQELTHKLTKTNELLAGSNERIALEKERAEESDRLKSAFLANMSHEIRTPLNAIIGFSELLSNNRLAEDQHKNFMEIIRSSGDQLLHIVEDILDISKIESNQIKLFYKEVNLMKIFHEIHEIAINQVKSKKKQIKIALEFQENLKNVSIYTDEVRLKQVIQNLMSNAIKFTEEGSVTLSCSLNENQEMIRICVKDTGIGIPAAEKERIFERFFQSKNVAMNAGNGLGLSISKGLVNLLGGQIWVESEMGVGSTIYFTIPNKQTEAPEKAPDQKTRLADYTGKLFYIAEDNKFSFELMHEILQPCNATIQNARNGKELIKMIEKQKPDLILLDIRMPEMDGEQAIVEIRKSYLEIPVIAQSAYALAEEQEKYIELGCNAAISKPIDKYKLFELINLYLNT